MNQPDASGNRRRSPRAIGVGGTAARVVVGLMLLAIVLQGELSTRGINLLSLAVGLLGIPAVVLTWQWLRARRRPARLEATRPCEFVLNMAVLPPVRKSATPAITARRLI